MGALLALAAFFWHSNEEKRILDSGRHHALQRLVVVVVEILGQALERLLDAVAFLLYGGEGQRRHGVKDKETQGTSKRHCPLLQWQQHDGIWRLLTGESPGDRR